MRREERTSPKDSTRDDPPTLDGRDRLRRRWPSPCRVPCHAQSKPGPVAKSLARYVPAKDLVLYVEFDGIDAHAAAWKKTALYKVLTETKLGAMIDGAGDAGHRACHGAGPREGAAEDHGGDRRAQGHRQGRIRLRPDRASARAAGWRLRDPQRREEWHRRIRPAPRRRGREQPEDREEGVAHRHPPRRGAQGGNVVGRGGRPHHDLVRGHGLR